MSRVRVPLAVDAQLRIPVGPVQAPVRTLIIGALSLVPATLALATPTSLGRRLVLVVLVIAAATAVAKPTREGIWIGTYCLYRLGARWLPSHIHRNRWATGRVRVTDDAVVTNVSPRQRTSARWRRVAALAAAPVAQTVADGIFEMSPGGWRAVLHLEGPAVALESAEYQRWCETVVAWLRTVDCPAQLITVAGRVERSDAERAYDRACRFEPRHGPLVVAERRFAGELSAGSLAFDHHVVLAPRVADSEGRPHPCSLLTVAASAATRLDAERVLGAACNAATNSGVGVTVASHEDIAALLRSSLLGAREAVAHAGAAWLDGAHLGVLTVTRLGPDVDPGVVIRAIQRSEVRGTVCLHVLPALEASVRRHLSRRRGWLRYALREGRPDVDLEVALQDTESLQVELAAGRAGVARIALTVAVSATSRSRCRESMERLAAVLTGFGCSAEAVTVPGLWPLLAVAPGMPPLRRSLLMTTDSVIACLVPALGTPFSDVGQPVVGNNLRTGATAHLCVWSRPNFNVLAIGSSGSGKSTTIKTLLCRHVLQGANGFALDPASEYEGVIRLLGGHYAELAETAVNPLALGARESCDLAAGRIVTVLSVMAGDPVGYVGGRPIRRLPDEDKAWLHRELVAFLAGWRESHPASEPTLSALVDRLDRVTARDTHEADAARYRRLTLRFCGYTQGTLGAIFDRPSTFALVPGVPTGIGFRSLSHTYAADLTPALAVVLSHMLEAVLQRRERLVILVDEAHVLTSDPDAGKVLEQLVRWARHCRAGVWMASQKLDEFTSTELGRTLATVAATKIILGQEDTVAAQARLLFDLSADEAAALTPPVPGRAVLIAGGERTVVQVTPSPVLWPWVRTDEGAHRRLEVRA